MNSEVVQAAKTDIEIIKHRILEIRGERVMLDRDLAELYGVETKALNQAVKRNISRFPEDFMFQLNRQEFLSIMKSHIVTLKAENVEGKNDTDLKSQIVTSSWGGTRKMPYAFTEYGIVMLSSVLHSETAIQVNSNIMRAFIAIRHAVAAMQAVDLRYEQLSHKVDQLNAYVEEILHDQNDINEQQERTNMEIAIQIEAINDALDQLRDTKGEPRQPEHRPLEDVVEFF